MKQIQIKEVNQNIIYPIYENQDVNQEVCEHMGFDLNNIVDKKLNKITTVYTLGKYSFEKIIFVGLGKQEKLTTYQMRKVFHHVSQQIAEPAVFIASTMINSSISVHQIVRIFTETHLLAQYQEQIIGHDSKKIIDVDIIANKDVQDDIEKGIAYGEGINYARRLSDTPSNLMTPYHLVEEAKLLASQYGMECTILDYDDLVEMKAGGILSVNLGSHIPAYMICLKYTGGESKPYTAVIGKGLTFDSGGYNIKNNSYGMKYDMCGGADVLGIMKILAMTKSKKNVYGIIPTTENLVSGKAYKPQDVITTMSGKTVEIVSTDAEGRLILCDAITYAQELGATRLIDLATLTGACVSALGELYTGVFSNSDSYCEEILQSSYESDEKAWRLPIDPEYFEKLKSNSADFKNSVGKMGAGASVAANFLEAFVNDDVEWIHLDIAGTSDNDGTAATGAMIRTVSHMFE